MYPRLYIKRQSNGRLQIYTEGNEGKVLGKKPSILLNEVRQHAGMVRKYEEIKAAFARHSHSITRAQIGTMVHSLRQSISLVTGTRRLGGPYSPEYLYVSYGQGIMLQPYGEIYPHQLQPARPFARKSACRRLRFQVPGYPAGLPAIGMMPKPEDYGENIITLLLPDGTKERMKVYVPPNY